MSSPTSVRSLPWPLVIGLAFFALIRPLTRIIASKLEVTVHSALPLSLTIVITLVWAVVVGLSKTPAPVVTLVATGVSYAVLSILLSAVLSPILDGRLAGPLANPIAIVPLLLLNAGWGLIAGILALLVQRTRTAA